MHPSRTALPPNRHPLVIAHRGASETAAEHTLPAYLSAIDSGADGLECDVRLTRDGHLVCVHDRSVNRTSNGTGLVSELDLTGLRELDFSSWHAPSETAGPSEFLTSNSNGSTYLDGVIPDRMAPGSSAVLTLDTLLSLVADASRPLRLLIETKHPTRYGGLVEKELVRSLRRFGWASARSDAGATTSRRSRLAETPDPITIMSFAPTALRRIRLLAPSVPLVLLFDRAMPMRRDGSLPPGVRTAGPGVRVLRSDPAIVEKAHQHGNQVYCWTVDDAADVGLASGLGVDALITNRPAETRALLGFAPR